MRRSLFIFVCAGSHCLQGSSNHGVIKLIIRTMAADPTSFDEEIVFEGRNQTDVKRRMLKYWSEVERPTGVGLGEFQRRCTRRDDYSVVYERVMI